MSARARQNSSDLGRRLQVGARHLAALDPALVDPAVQHERVRERAPGASTRARRAPRRGEATRPLHSPLREGTRQRVSPRANSRTAFGCLVLTSKVKNVERVTVGQSVGDSQDD